MDKSPWDSQNVTSSLCISQVLSQKAVPSFYKSMSPPPFPPNTMLKDQRNCALTVSTLSVGWGEGDNCPKTFVHDCSSFLFFFFQTFNGNFDQNKVEKQILFSAFVARYLRFVVGSKHGGACLRVEVSGVPRSRGLIYCRNCSVFKEYSFLPTQLWNLPSHH